MATESCFLIEHQPESFWKMEEVEEPKKPKLEELNEHFLATYKRLKNGRFEVKLPFKNDVKLENNRRQALAQFKRHEAKQGPEKEAYCEFMREYERLNHMSLILSQKEDRYYIPHRAVLRPMSTSTKLRVVFNASSRTPTGYALNDT